MSVLSAAEHASQVRACATRSSAADASRVGLEPVAKPLSPNSAGRPARSRQAPSSIASGRGGARQPRTRPTSCAARRGSCSLLLGDSLRAQDPPQSTSVCVRDTSSDLGSLSRTRSTRAPQTGGWDSVAARPRCGGRIWRDRSPCPSDGGKFCSALSMETPFSFERPHDLRVRLLTVHRSPAIARPDVDRRAAEAHRRDDGNHHVRWGSRSRRDAWPFELDVLSRVHRMRLAATQGALCAASSKAAGRCDEVRLRRMLRIPELSSGVPIGVAAGPRTGSPAVFFCTEGTAARSRSRGGPPQNARACCPAMRIAS